MASPVGYQSFCPVGAALNVVGERWALLVVRDLLLGPRRYSDLLAGLGGIGTDILAARLRALNEHGIVRQTGEGRGRRYELTDAGQALRPVLRELARWGADRVALPADRTQIPPRVPLTSLLLGATYPRQADGAYEVRVEDEVVRVDVAAGELHPASQGEPTATIELTRPGLSSLIVGNRASDMEQAGDVAIEGDRKRARAFLNALTGPPLLAGLRPPLDGGSTDR